MTVATEVKTVISVGCGRPSALLPDELRDEERWKILRVDIDPEVQPDLVASATSLTGIEDDSVDAVWTKALLDHLYPVDVDLALAEFARVLKPGGTCIVCVLDFEKLATAVVAGKLEEVVYQSPAGAVSVIDQIFGFRSDLAKGNMFIAKHTAFTKKTLCKHLTKAGFVSGPVVRSDRLMKDAILAVVRKKGVKDANNGNAV